VVEVSLHWRDFREKCLRRREWVASATGVI